MDYYTEESRGIPSIIKEKDMMKCRVCGEMNPDGNKYCASCGARLETNDNSALTEALETAEKEFDKDSLVSMDKSRITYVCSV